MKKVLGLFLLLIGMFLLLFVRQENELKRQEKAKTLETVREFSRFAKKNNIGFEHQVIDKRTGKVQYQIDFVGAVQGVNLKIRQKNKNHFNVKFKYVPSTNWDDLVVLCDQWGDYEIKEAYYLSKEERMNVLKGEEKIFYLEELQSNLQEIMKDTNFLLQRKAFLVPQNTPLQKEMMETLLLWEQEDD